MNGHSVRPDPRQGRQMAHSTVLVLPDERPMSWNMLYSGVHWSKRKREKDRVQMVVRASFDAAVVNAGPYEVPVTIDVHAYFQNKQLDADNICTKLYVDALKGWVIEDDDPAHVVTVRPWSYLDEKNPRVELEIRPAGS